LGPPDVETEDEGGAEAEDEDGAETEDDAAPLAGSLHRRWLRV